MWITEGNAESVNQAFVEIRRLWHETGGEELLPASSRDEELQAYYNATILNVLCELEELKELSVSVADAEFMQRFKTAQRLMFKQMRLLSNIGRVLLPLPIVQNPQPAL